MQSITKISVDKKATFLSSTAKFSMYFEIRRKTYPRSIKERQSYKRNHKHTYLNLHAILLENKNMQETPIIYAKVN